MYMVRASSPAAERRDFSKAQKDATLGHLLRNTISHVAPEERKVQYLKYSEMNPPSSPEPQFYIHEPLSLRSQKGQVHHTCRSAPVKWVDNILDIYYPAHLYHNCWKVFRPVSPLRNAFLHGQCHGNDPHLTKGGAAFMRFSLTWFLEGANDDLSCK